MWLAVLAVLVFAASLALIVTMLRVLPNNAELRVALDRFRVGFSANPTPIVFVFCLFLLGGIAGGLKLFASNTDLELLLASPIHNSVVVCSELLGLAIELAITPVALFTPIAVLLLARGIWQPLGGYIAIASVSMVAASMGVMLTYLSIRRFGFRVTRFWVQLFNGSVFFIYIFATNLIAPLFGTLLQQVPGLATAMSGLTVIPAIVAGTVFLDPGPTVVCVGASTLCLWGSTRAIGRTIVNTNMPSGDRRRSPSDPPKPTANTGQFSSSLSWLLMLKEWRLLWRDNSVRASLLLQVFAYVYFLHYFSQQPAESAASGNVLLAGLTVAVGNSLAIRFITRMAIAEEASELLVSCPVPPENIKTAKVLAAWIPAVALVFPFTLVAMWQGLPWMVAFIIAAISTGSTCLMGIWGARGVNKADLFNKGKERKQDAILRFLQTIHYFLWLTIGSASAASGGIAIVIVAIAVAGLIPTMALAFARSYQLRKLAYF